MRQNLLRQKLEAGIAAIGVMITFPSPPVTEMLGYLRFDQVLLDNEHGSITVENAEDMIREAEPTRLLSPLHYARGGCRGQCVTPLELKG